jgi:hypothetical protein
MKTEDRLTLYDITDDIVKVFDAVTEREGEVTPELDAALQKAEALLLEKAHRCAGYRESLEDAITRIESRIEELEALKMRFKSKLESFDDYVTTCLRKLPEQEIKGDLVTIKLRKPAKQVEIYDEALIPLEFVKIPEPKAVIQKAEIAKALKDGVDVPGARLVDGKQSVTYKVGV